MAPLQKGRVFRVSGLPLSPQLSTQLRAAIDDNLDEKEKQDIKVTVSVIPSCYTDDEMVGLVEFHGRTPDFLSELDKNPSGEWQIVMEDDIDVTFDQHFFGFTQLYPFKSPVTADIIAITGLDGHAYGSWRGRGNLGRMWLRDFLAKDLSSCRTMVYGYDSKLSTHGVGTILDYGRGLIEEIQKIRDTDETRQRPLYFIAHSFGGIILAHCLVKAHAARDDGHPTIAALHNATYGMLLFGIPYKGLVVDDIQKMLCGNDDHPREAVLQQIRVKSDILAFQLIDFKNIIKDRKIVSFYEMQKTKSLQFDSESKRWKRTGEYITIVETESALLQLPESMEVKIPVDSDHSAMVKFDSRNHRAYTSALKRLQQFELLSKEVVEARFGKLVPSDSMKADGHLSNQKLLEIPENKQCLRDLLVTDPRDDKTRIESEKGELLIDSYSWVIHHPPFQQWRDDAKSRLFWIKGDPGKGKTMMLCGIINKLKDEASSVSYFFCQATDSRINKATSVLRGLIYMMVRENPLLVSHVRKEYDVRPPDLFEGVNAWVVLCNIFVNILKDQSGYIVVDGLDECKSDLQKLLKLIVEKSCKFPKVKWIVTSRNWPEIEGPLGNVTEKFLLSLELNEDAVSTAVTAYIEDQVKRLAEKKTYKKSIINQVRKTLISNSNKTFLWVALVCKELADEDVTVLNIAETLLAMPPGLEDLYNRMLHHISASRNARHCKKMLAIVSTVYRPVSLCELRSLMGLSDAFDDEDVMDLAKRCGSLIIINDGVLRLVHQSAADFISKMGDRVCGEQDVHHALFSQSLKAMSVNLACDVYGLISPGTLIQEVTLPDPESDPLAAVKYSCVYWVDHLRSSRHSIGNMDGCSLKCHDEVLAFMRKYLLNWLEALSLLEKFSEGVLAISLLCSSLTHRTWTLRDINGVLDPENARDAEALESTTLGLWDAETGAPFKLLGDDLSIEQTAFMAGGQRVAAVLSDYSARVWDVVTGTLVHSIESPGKFAKCSRPHRFSSPRFVAAVSPDQKVMASVRASTIIEMWDMEEIMLLRTHESHTGEIHSIRFSPDSLLMVASTSCNFTIWDARSGTCLRKLALSAGKMAFSSDSKLLAVRSVDPSTDIVRLWDRTRQTPLFKEPILVDSVAFSPDGELMALSSVGSIELWDAASCTRIRTLRDYGNGIRINNLVFAHDSRLLAFVTVDAEGGSTINLCDAAAGTIRQTFQSHPEHINALIFSPNNNMLASVSESTETVRIWSIATGRALHALHAWTGRLRRTCNIEFSPDGSLIVARDGRDQMERVSGLWRTASGASVGAPDGEMPGLMAFSPDGKLVASCPQTGDIITVWVTQSRTVRHLLTANPEPFAQFLWSPDGRLLAAVSGCYIQLWNTATGTMVHTLEDSQGIEPRNLAFSHDGKHLVSQLTDETVRLWDIQTGNMVREYTPELRSV
ncbi:hypothetical protein CDD80_2476 [Ophiocordyceps camponoti-rufipedis]|uniref:NACHT domain-containing protein n=1 Tax=Ophiocordyceps camponoti-rufipedis TaxID=2004952 RepID=A0A2C5Z6A6_9HYPO|nr:hypothetical protein CDD80_2476 [Ophiocordyceps camponoti-rufipedis]